MNRAEIRALNMWAVKWVIVAVIVVAAFQGRVLLEEARTTLERHNQLLGAVLNEFQMVTMQRAQRQKAQQELPQKDDPVPTEEPQ